jgi:hypothetical protein
VNAGDVIQRFSRVRKTNRGWSARCPSHNDGTNSLALAIGANGKVLVHCYAACATAEVLRAVGLKLRDLFPEELAHVTTRPTRRLSRLAEMRREALAEARRQRKRLAPYRETFADADSVRGCYAVAARARLVATATGDCTAAWTLLGAAAELERFAFLGEARLDAERIA